MSERDDEALQELNYAMELTHQREAEQEYLRADPAYGEWLDSLNQQRNTNMELDDLVTSKSRYLKKEDVGTEGKNLTIAAFEKVMVKNDDGDEEQKVIIHFTNQDFKPMILNISNKDALKEITGETTVEGVKGKTVNVYNDPKVKFGPKAVGGLRIREARPAAPLNRGALGGKSDADVPF
jgi:hypothetical protein